VRGQKQRVGGRSKGLEAEAKGWRQKAKEGVHGKKGKNNRPDKIIYYNLLLVYSILYFSLLVLLLNWYLISYLTRGMNCYDIKTFYDIHIPYYG